MRRFILTSILSLLTLGFAQIHADEVSKQKLDPKYEQNDSLEYGSFYTKSECLVAPEHAIIFDRETVCPKGIEHPEGTGDFIIKEPGIYRVTYSASVKDCGGILALQLDGHVLPGTEMFVGVTDQLSTLSALVKICDKPSCCNHVLRVINNFPLSTGWYSHDIYLRAGGQDTVTAAILIEKVTHCKKKCACKS